MRVLYVTTISITMGFFPSHIKMLQNHGNVVDLACNLETGLPEKIKALNCKEHHIPFSRSPLSKDNLLAYRELKKLLETECYDIIHTHTPNASVLVRLACRRLRKQETKVFYTAHGFHFYSGAPLKNWLLYYPIERFLSRWTDILITINKEDYERAKKRFHAARTEYIPGVGIDLARFDFAFSSEDKAAKRKEIGVPEDAFLLMSVGELNQNKNHEVMLKALKLLDDPRVHYCIAGEGPLRKHLLQVADDLELSKQVHLLGYRRDVPELYKSSDVCCFPSIREGLGLAALEAMACGVPVVAADNRGTRDFVVDGENGFLCAYDDAETFSEKVKVLRESPQLRLKMGDYAKAVVAAFSADKAVCELKRIYGF